MIPLLLKDAELHPRLSVIQHLDFRDTKKAPWKKLLQEIARTQASRDEEEPLERVGDMTVEQLQELIGGAVALARASAKDTHEASPEVIDRAAKGVTQAARRISRLRQISRVEHPRGEHTSPEILWVDDRPENNTYERSAFEALGYRFTLAVSTREALELSLKKSFSAIISDMGRPEGPHEGYALLKALREQGDETPFFIYTGASASKNKVEATRKGARGLTHSAEELFELVTQAVW